MIFPDSELLNWVAYGVLTTLSVSMVLAFFRLVRGPSLSDRVIALDLIAFIAIGFIATYAVSTGKATLLDAATVLALIAFLGTIAFARYVQRSHKKEGEKSG